jgi:hypothetical protein
VLRTRSPRAHSLYCYRKLRVRLACVKHAASVRSEPGSNSHLKLVVPRTGFSEEKFDSRERTFTSLGSTQNPITKIRGGKPSRSPFWANQTGSGMFHPNCQRAGTSWPAGRSTDKRQLYGCSRRMSTTNPPKQFLILARQNFSQFRRRRISTFSDFESYAVAVVPRSNEEVLYSRQ